MSATTTATRTLAAARAASGAVLLVTAPDVLTRLEGGRPPAHAVTAARILALRELVQGTVTAVRPSRLVAHGAAGVDLLHLASMVALAIRSPAYRRLAVVSGTQAAAAVGAGYLIARRGRRTKR